MEIAAAILGITLTVLGLIFGWMWKSNGKLQAQMMAALEEIKAGQERLGAGQERLGAGLERVGTGLERLGEMLMNQTKILERIEGKV